MSHDGFEKLLIQMGEGIPSINQLLKTKFELQDENVLKSAFLLDYNIKPRDILELIPQKELEDFAKAREIESRGDLIANVLDAYKDSENLFLENYENFRYQENISIRF